MNKKTHNMKDYFPKFVDRRKRESFELNKYAEDKKIVIFGDSYAKSHDGPIDDLGKNWYAILHDRTKRRVITHGQGGTSLLYSKQELFKYLNSETYNEDDWIIFISTSYSRIPFVHIDDGWKPYQQSQIFSYLSDVKIDDIDYSIIEDNKDALEWVARGITQEDFINDVSMLQAFLNSLPNKTVLIPAFRYYAMEKFLDIKDFSLVEVSEQETIHESLFHDGKEKLFIKTDPRYNHMSNRNNEVLAVKIQNYFNNGDISTFTLKGFSRT